MLRCGKWEGEWWSQENQIRILKSVCITYTNSFLFYFGLSFCSLRTIVTIMILVRCLLCRLVPVDEEYPEEQESFHSRFLDYLSA